MRQQKVLRVCQAHGICGRASKILTQSFTECAQSFTEKSFTDTGLWRFAQSRTPTRSPGRTTPIKAFSVQLCAHSVKLCVRILLSSTRYHPAAAITRHQPNPATQSAMQAPGFPAARRQQSGGCESADHPNLPARPRGLLRLFGCGLSGLGRDPLGRSRLTRSTQRFGTSPCHERNVPKLRRSSSNKAVAAPRAKPPRSLPRHPSDGGAQPTVSL
jgi:hypothetical protein